MPLCGGKANIETDEHSDGQCHYEVKYVMCEECKAHTEERVCDGYYGCFCTDEEIAELWNRRI